MAHLRRLALPGAALCLLASGCTLGLDFEPGPEPQADTLEPDTAADTTSPDTLEPDVEPDTLEPDTLEPDTLEPDLGDTLEPDTLDPCQGVSAPCPAEGARCEGDTLVMCAPDRAQNDCLVETSTDCTEDVAGGTCAEPEPNAAMCVDPCPACPKLTPSATSMALHAPGSGQVLELAADASSVIALSHDGTQHLVHCLLPSTLGRSAQALSVEAALGTTFVPAAPARIELVPGWAIIAGEPTLFVDRTTCTLMPSALDLDAPLVLETLSAFDADGRSTFLGVTPGQDHVVTSYEIVPAGAPQTEIDLCLPSTPAATAPCIRPLCDAGTCAPTLTFDGTLQLAALPAPSNNFEPQLVLTLSNYDSGTAFALAHALDASTTPPQLSPLGTQAPHQMLVLGIEPLTDASALLRFPDTLDLVEVDRVNMRLETRILVAATVQDVARVADDSGAGHVLAVIEDGLRWIVIGSELEPALQPVLVENDTLAPVEHVASDGSNAFVVTGDAITKLTVSQRSF